MYKKLCLALVCAFALAIFTGQSSAQDEEKKNKRGNNQLVKNLLRPFAKAELTDEQKEKAQALIKKNSESLVALQKDLNGMLSNDKRKARREAQKKAKEQGLKGKKAAEFIWKEIGIDEATVKKIQEKSKAFNQARVKLQREIYAMLNDDQKSKVKARGIKGGGKGKGKGKKKKRKKDDGDGGDKKIDDGGGQ